jgi:hypothetical protein
VAEPRMPKANVLRTNVAEPRMPEANVAKQRMPAGRMCKHECPLGECLRLATSYFEFFSF